MPREGLTALHFLLLAGAVLVASPASVRAAGARAPVSIYFETQLPYFYEGDPLHMAMTVKNVSESPVDNSKGIDLLGGMQVEDARGAKLKAADGTPPLVSQPKSLEKSAFFGRVLEMTEIFPGLRKAGNYRVSWKGPDGTSNDLILHIVEKYDPKRDYQARLETDFGPIVIALAKEAAPRHVRNFIDLVRQGFYNGNQFHRVIPGQAIVGGSPTGDVDGGAGYNLKPELSDLPVEAGTVVQVRNQETGPDDSGSNFMISAIGSPDLRGRVTVLGRVVEGLDTVKTICVVPTVQEKGTRGGLPPRPVKPVLIRKVTLTDVTGKVQGKSGAKKPAGAKKGS